VTASRPIQPGPSSSRHCQLGTVSIVLIYSFDRRAFADVAVALGVAADGLRLDGLDRQVDASGQNVAYMPSGHWRNYPRSSPTGGSSSAAAALFARLSEAE
jgi:hypothetical protein